MSTFSCLYSWRSNYSGKAQKQKDLMNSQVFVSSSLLLLLIESPWFPQDFECSISFRKNRFTSLLTRFYLTFWNGFAFHPRCKSSCWSIWTWTCVPPWEPSLVSNPVLALTQGLAMVSVNLCPRRIGSPNKSPKLRRLGMSWVQKWPSNLVSSSWQSDQHYNLDKEN